MAGSSTVWTSTFPLPIQHRAFTSTSFPGMNGTKVLRRLAGHPIQARRRGALLAVNGRFDSRYHSARAVRLPVSRRNLSSLHQSFEVPQILDHRLFGVTSSGRFPSVEELPHAELLQHSDD